MKLEKIVVVMFLIIHHHSTTLTSVVTSAGRQKFKVEFYWSLCYFVEYNVNGYNVKLIAYHFSKKSDTKLSRV